MRTIAVVLALLALTAVSVPVARADELFIQVIDGAEEKSPEYLNFFGTFATTLFEGVGELKKSGEWNPPPNNWIILLSQVLSMTGETLIEIHATSSKESRRLPVLIATISERSDAATVRTAARSAQRLIVETAMRWRETPSSPPQKFRMNLRTKQRAEVSISIPRMWYRTNHE